MTVRFYMNAQGEVLDNVKHPVTAPGLVVPVLPKIRVRPLSDAVPETFEVAVVHYRAIQIHVPDA